MEQIFTNIYESKAWGDNGNAHYSGSSGPGSDVHYNATYYIPTLKQFIAEKGICSVVDLGCGDFRCGPAIYDDLDVIYTGYDAYKKVVDHNTRQHPGLKYSFVHLDFFHHRESIQHGDLCILKDVLQHWSVANITTFLDYLIEHKKFKYIWICNCCEQPRDNTDISNGGFRPLSCDYLPLKKYGATKIIKYHSKEVSVIQVDGQ